MANNHNHKLFKRNTMLNAIFFLFVNKFLISSLEPSETIRSNLDDNVLFLFFSYNHFRNVQWTRIVRVLLLLLIFFIHFYLNIDSGNSMQTHIKMKHADWRQRLSCIQNDCKWRAAEVTWTARGRRGRREKNKRRKQNAHVWLAFVFLLSPNSLCVICNPRERANKRTECELNVVFF